MIKRRFSNFRMSHASGDLRSTQHKNQLLDSLVLFHPRYADVGYGLCITIRVAFNGLKTCVTFICALRKFDHLSHAISDLRWLRLLERGMLHCGRPLQKILILISPRISIAKISCRTDVLNLNISRKHLNTHPLHKTKLFPRSPSYNIYKVFNKLPLNLVDLESQI